MLKLLVLLALVLAVIYFFSWANRRPPGDWRRREDPDDRPINPTGSIGMDRGSRSDLPDAPEDVYEKTGSDQDRPS